MADKLCPLLKSPCIEHGCRWWFQVMGTMPQTGEVKSEWGCAIEWLPVLLIENSKETRQAAAAVEHSRNEAVRSASVLAGGLSAVVDVLAQVAQPRGEQDHGATQVIDDRVESCKTLYLTHKKG